MKPTNFSEFSPREVRGANIGRIIFLAIMLFVILVCKSCVSSGKLFDKYHAPTNLKCRLLGADKNNCDSVYVLIQAAKDVEVFCKIHKRDLRYSKTTVLGLN
jgi:hypothetical protein